MMSFEELVQEELSKPNYLIEKSQPDSEEAYTVIYFSSSGIYNEDNAETFTKEIIEKNRFEYFGTRIKKASKHIFLRDITKKWYFDGINKEINSTEKLLEFLKKETIGTKIITLGSSAGGYAAILFGILLNAEYIFSFSAQYSLIPCSEYINYRAEHKNSEYFNLTKLIESSDIPIFYLFPSKVEHDITQFNLVKKFKNIYAVPIKSSTHGIPVIKDTLRSLINSDLKDLKKIYRYKDKAPMSELVFLFKSFGILKALSRIIRKNFECFKGKYLKTS